MVSPKDVQQLLAHQEWVQDLARRLVFDDETANDLVQEAWLAALSRAPAGIESPRGFLATVARRIAGKKRLKESLRRKHEKNAARDEAVEAVLEGVDDRLETYELIARAVYALEENARAVIVMRYYEGLAPKDIAARLGILPSTVRSRLTRACDDLRRLLDRRHGDRGHWALLLARVIDIRSNDLWKVAAPELFMAVGLVLSAATVIVAALRAPNDQLVPAESTRGDAVVLRRSAERSVGDERTASSDSSALVSESQSMTVAISGRLTDARGEPIARARVVAFDRARPFGLGPDSFARLGRYFKPMPFAVETTTGDDGRYVLNVPLGLTYDILAVSLGHGRTTLGRGVAAAVANLGEQKLPQTAIVRAIVVDENDRPIPDVQVDIRFGEAVESAFTHCSNEIIETRADGSFEYDSELQEDPADPRRTGGDAARLSTSTTLLAMRRPGYTTALNGVAEARPIDADGRVIFRLTHARKVVVRTLFDGKPAPNVRFGVRGASSQWQGTGTTGPDGTVVLEDCPDVDRFYFAVDDSERTIVRFGDDRDDGMEQRVNVKKGDGAIADVLLRASEDVVGVVVDARTGRPVPGVTLIGSPEGRLARSPSHVVRATSGTDGHFRLHGLGGRMHEVRVLPGAFAAGDPHGRVLVDVPLLGDRNDDHRDRPRIVKKMRDLLYLSILCSADGTPAEIELPVVPAARTTGRVLDANGAPIAGAIVSYVGNPRDIATWPQSVQKDLERSAVSGSDGRFDLGGLLPDASKKIEIAFPDGGCMHCDFGDCWPLDVEIRRPPAKDVTVRVADEEGRPVSGVSVAILPGGGRPIALPRSVIVGTTNAAGEFATSRCVPGVLRAWIDTFGSRAFTIPDPRGNEISWDGSDTLTIDFVLPRTRVVRGRVRLESGEAIAGAVVYCMGRPGSQIADRNSAGAAVSGRVQSAVTNRDGEFTIDLPRGRDIPFQRVQRTRHAPTGFAEENWALPEGAMIRASDDFVDLVVRPITK